MATITCPNCGTENPAGTMNCKQCQINLKFALEKPDLLKEAEKGELAISVPLRLWRAQQRAILAWALALPLGWLAGWAIAAAITYNTYTPHESIPQHRIQAFRESAASQSGGLGGMVGLLIAWVIALAITLSALRSTIPSLRTSQIIWAILLATLPVGLLWFLFGGL